MFKSVCAMYRHYHYDKQPCLLLHPLIVFGAQHDYNKQCKKSLANSTSFHLSTTKKSFCSTAKYTVNQIKLPTDCNYNSFVLSVRDLPQL